MHVNERNKIPFNLHQDFFQISPRAREDEDEY